MAAPQNKKDKKKMSIGLKIFLFVILPILVIIIATPVIFIYGFLYDNGSSGFEPDANFNSETELKAVALRGFDNTEETGKIDINLSTNTINNILYESADSSGGVISDTTLSIEGDTYVLSAKVAVAAPMLVTKVYISFEVNHEESVEDTLIVMTLKDIKVGRLGGLTDLAMSMLGSSFDDRTVVNMFKEAGITVQSDIANKRIKISQNSLMDDVKKMALKGGNNEIMSAMLDNFFSAGLVSFSHDNNNALSVSMNLASLKENTTYQNPAKDALNFTTNDAREKIATLLNNNAVTLDHADSVYKFLYYGYPRVDTQIQTLVDNLDLSSVNITNASSYLGYSADLNKDTNADEEVKNSTDPVQIAATGEIAQISENIFDKSMRGEDIIGYTYAFKGEDHGTYKYNAITIDNFYTVIKDGELDLVCSVSVNGYDTHLIINTETQATPDNYCLNLKVVDVYYGTQKASETLIDALYDLIHETVNSTWFRMDKVNRTFTLDFSTAITSVMGAEAAINARGGCSLSLHAGANPGEGYLSIKTNN